MAKLPAKRGETKPARWRGDEHQLQAQAAQEAGLDRTQAELESFTEGFKAGITLQDDFDGAIVARGRTVLKQRELFNALRPALQYLGVGRDAMQVKVHQGDFELRITKQAADASNPALDAAKLALRLWVGIGLFGAASYVLIHPAVAGVVWGIGLLIGGWQLRQGMASGRAMLSARLALALGMLAHEEQLILPPAAKADDG